MPIGATHPSCSREIVLNYLELGYIWQAIRPTAGVLPHAEEAAQGVPQYPPHSRYQEVAREDDCGGMNAWYLLLQLVHDSKKAATPDKDDELYEEFVFWWTTFIGSPTAIISKCRVYF